MPSLEMRNVRLVEASARAISSTAMACVTRSATGAAVLRRQLQRGQLDGLEGSERLPAVLGPLVGLGGQWGDLVLAELPEDPPELVLLLGEGDGLVSYA